ncbi:MAG: hypothetical protein JXO44_05225 [Clostridia bacterium]|nr:hypothetical protein [Clostridia bacterium]
MDKRLNVRINKYMVISMMVLIVFNLAVGLYREKVVVDYISTYYEMSALMLKEQYEDDETLRTFYNSNGALYNQYDLAEWCNLIDGLYHEVDSNEIEAFYDYLDTVSRTAQLEIEIFDGDTFEQDYPTGHEGVVATISGLNVDSVRKTLVEDGNLFHEVNDGQAHYVLNVRPLSDGNVIALRRDGAFSDYGIGASNRFTRIDAKLQATLQSDWRLDGYYVLSEDDQILFSNVPEVTGRYFDVDEALGAVLTSSSPDVKTTYRGAFNINGTAYDAHILFYFPLQDGCGMIAVADNPMGAKPMNELRFFSILMTIIGVASIYLIGQVVFYIVSRHPVTAKRITASSRPMRMVVMIFVMLILLDGLVIIQIGRIVFFDHFETEHVRTLSAYSRKIESREEEYKAFISKIMEDARFRFTLYHDGVKDFVDPEAVTKGKAIVTDYNYGWVPDVNQTTLDVSYMTSEIENKGYFEYYVAPKLFSKNDFDAFYENYIMEGESEDFLHQISLVTLFPAKDGKGYDYVKYHMHNKMRLLETLNRDFNLLETYDDHVSFATNITIYNDSGKIIRAGVGKEKVVSKNRKDFLTGESLWYLYQFNHDEVFRTVERSVEGYYNILYSVVHYSDELECYFVYTVPHDLMKGEMERLYNGYVFAMIVLLTGVFLTLNIKVKRIRRSE